MRSSLGYIASGGTFFIPLGMVYAYYFDENFQYIGFDQIGPKDFTDLDEVRYLATLLSSNPPPGTKRGVVGLWDSIEGWIWTCWFGEIPPVFPKCGRA